MNPGTVHRNEVSRDAADAVARMPRKTVAILQSCYIPWKGYFDMVNQVDEFILFDCVQYTRRDWRNRNRIKTPDGPNWLTIPVQVKGKYLQSIRDTMVSSEQWASQHWRTICQWYGKAPHFEAYRRTFESLYLDCRETHLSRINHRFLTALCEILGITTAITWSEDYEVIGGKNARLISLCRQAGATDYLSGPSAAGYIQPELFSAEGIHVHWMDYSNYPEYPQLYPPFDHHVSILDLLFNTGADAPRYMKSFAS